MKFLTLLFDKIMIFSRRQRSRPSRNTPQDARADRTPEYRGINLPEYDLKY
jgi:hypothetical protein